MSQKHIRGQSVVRCVVVADDDLTSRTMTAALITKWGYDVIQAADGNEVLTYLTDSVRGPVILLLDWEMPGITGVQLCRRIARDFPDLSVYIIILTGRGEIQDIVEGLDAGADDYITKPYANAELHSRFGAGERILKLESELRKKVEDLERAIAEVKTLSGLLPMCSRCKRVRNDEGYWDEVEGYIQTHTNASFSHGLCPQCVGELYPDHAERILEANRRRESTPTESG